MKKNGFTLIELVIAMGMGLVIMAAVYASMNMAQRSSASVVQKVVTQQDARAVLDIMAMEIRMASFNPRMSGGTWSTIPSNTFPVDTINPPFIRCTQMGLEKPDPINKGIQIATANKILIVMDLNDDGVIGCNCGACCATNTCAENATCRGTSEYIMYSYNSTDHNITRNVTCNGNSDILGDPNNSTGTMVMNNNTSPVTSLFQYFDRDSNDITATLTVNNIPNNNTTNGIPAIRRIRITIVADTENTDSLTGKTKRMTYTTDVLVKNHVLSQ